MDLHNFLLFTSIIYISMSFSAISIANGLPECFHYKTTEFRIFRINLSPLKSSEFCKSYGAALAKPSSIKLINLFRTKMVKLNMQELTIAAKYCSDPNKNIYYWSDQTRIKDVIYKSLKPVSYRNCGNCYCISLHRHDPTTNKTLNEYVKPENQRNGSTGYICQRKILDSDSCQKSTTSLQKIFATTQKDQIFESKWSTLLPQNQLEKSNKVDFPNTERFQNSLTLRSFLQNDKVWISETEKLSTPRQKRTLKKQKHRSVGSADSQKQPWDAVENSDINIEEATPDLYYQHGSIFTNNTSSAQPKKSFVEANELLKSLNDSLTRDLKNEKSLTPRQLQEVAFSFLKGLAPEKLSKPLEYLADNGKEYDYSQNDCNNDVKDYALNFMEITSILLDDTNTKSWTEVSKTTSDKEKMSPTDLLEQMDDMLDYSAKYFDSNQTNVIFQSEQLEVKVQSLVMENNSLVIRDTNEISNEEILERKIRDLSGSTNGVFTVVSTTYKTIPHLMNAVLIEKGRAVKNGSGKGQGEKYCHGFPVSKDLCSEMNVNGSSISDRKAPEFVWVFPDKSSVMSITVFNATDKKTLPVIFDIHHNSDVIVSKYSEVTSPRFKDHRCVYYDVITKLWSDFGCRATSLDQNKATCDCNHTTSFALILLVPVSRDKNTGNGQSERDILLTSLFHESVEQDGVMCGVALQMISYVTGGLSIAFLIVSVLFFAFARRSSDRTEERNTIHMCLAISMLLLHVVLLVDEPQLQTISLGSANVTQITDVNPGWLCYTITAVTHFLLLCNFSWMTLEGILLYLCVVTGDLRHKTLGKWKHVIGWSFPAIITVIAVVFGFTIEESYISIFFLKSNPSTLLKPGSDVYGYICYLSRDLSWFAFVPVAVSLTINIFIMIRVMVVIGRLTRESRFYKPTSQTLTNYQVNKKAVKKSLLAFCKLYPVLGITWSIALIAPFVPKDAFCYMEVTHSIVNGIQGVFFFLVTVIQNEENRALISTTWHRISHDTRSLVDSWRSRKMSSNNPVVLTASKTIPHSLSPPHGRQTNGV